MEGCGNTMEGEKKEEKSHGQREREKHGRAREVLTPWGQLMSRREGTSTCDMGGQHSDLAVAPTTVRGGSTGLVPGRLWDL